METITNIDEFWYNVWQLTKKHSKGKNNSLKISSFGMFSSQNNSMVKHYLEMLQGFNYKSVNLVIGMSKYNPCKKDCLDCYNKYCRQVIATKKLIKPFDFINTRMVYESHFKLFMAKSSLGCDYIVGGINFGDSQWSDSAVVLSGENKGLEDIFDYVNNMSPQFDFVPQLVPDEDPIIPGVIRFGKYKGHTWNEVLKINPQYIDWCRKENIKVEL